MAFPGASRGTPRGMPGVTCYICGRQYGRQSLDIHQKQCLDKWKAEQAKLPKHLRQKMPKPPEQGVSAEEANDQAFTNWKESLAACPNCARTFLPDRLEVHLRSCKPGAAKRAPVRSSSSASPADSSPGASSAARGARGPASVAIRPPAKGAMRTSIRAPARNDDNGAGGGAGDDDGEALPAPSPGSYDLSQLDDSTLGGSAGSPSGLAPCPNCGRNFAVDRLAKHAAVCTSSTKKRRTFDSTKARVKGTDAAAFVRAGAPARAPAVPANNWRRKHEEFQKAIRNARKISAIQAAGGDLSALPPPEYDPHDEYVPCPHCGRRFAEATAERHIPKCASIVSKPAAPPRSNRYAPGGERSTRASPPGAVARIGASAPRAAVAPRQAPARVSPQSTARAAAPPPSATTAATARRSTPTGRAPAGSGGGGSRVSSGPAGAGGSRVAKFCGDCGTAFSSDKQRFCGECGTPRT